MGSSGDRSATFVLVHPAWFGGWSWRKLAPLLRAAGHEVHTPTLTGLGERDHLLDRRTDLSLHVQDVVRVLDTEDLREVILVGNSSGGMVIAGVADAVPHRLRQVVYVDAFVPEDGQSLVDLVPPDRRQGMEDLVETEGEGWLLPRFAALPEERILRELFDVTAEEDLDWILPRLRPTPFRHFTERLRLGEPGRIPRAYVRCRGHRMDRHPVFDRHAEMAAGTPGWRLVEINASHLPHITHPQALAETLIGLADADSGGAGPA
jgi:pimeloyl-ACP methyl ester carboxylesterase